MTLDPSPVRWDAKFGLTPKGMLVGSKADYRSSDYTFPRTQSMVMRQMEWERREPRMEGWGKAAFGLVLWIVLIASATFLAWVVTL